MIDFRYHLVSIVAVFLSLAIGLVVGANALQGSVLRTLTAFSKDLNNRNTDLRNKNSLLTSQVGGDEQLAAVLAPQIVVGRLKDQSVVFVQTPGGSNAAYQQLVAMVKAAGAAVQGEVTIQNQYVQDDQVTVLDQLASSFHPAGVSFAGNATTYDRAGAVLASALVTNQPSQAGTEETSGILAGFAEAKFITISGTPNRRATLAIVIAPSTPDRSGTVPHANDAMVSLAGALAGADRATVLAGPPAAAQGGGLITALRESSVSAKVSSVDTVETVGIPTPSGQVVVVLALEAGMAGKVGAYGVGPGAHGYLPILTPTPAGKGT